MLTPRATARSDSSFYRTFFQFIVSLKKLLSILKIQFFHEILVAKQLNTLNVHNFVAEMQAVKFIASFKAAHV